MYHEHIFFNDQVVAQILSDTHKDYWFVINGNLVSAGYATVSDAKAALFPELALIYG
jgi:hypothetical protein